MTISKYLLFLSLGVYAMVTYVRRGRELFQFEDVSGDGSCLYHALARGFGTNDDGRNLRRMMAEVISHDNASFIDILKVYQVEQHRNEGKIEMEWILSYVENLRSELSSSTQWGAEEHMFLFSLITGNRVVCLQPKPEGVDKVYDTLEKWNTMFLYGLQAGLPLPSSVRLGPTSHTQYLYFHKYNNLDERASQKLDHFGYLRPLVTLNCPLDGLPDVFSTSPSGSILPNNRVRGYDIGRPENGAPGGRQKRLLNARGRAFKKVRSKSREQRALTELEAVGEGYDRYLDLFNGSVETDGPSEEGGEDLVAESEGNGEEEPTLRDSSPVQEDEMAKTNKRKSLIFADSDSDTETEDISRKKRSRRCERTLEAEEELEIRDLKTTPEVLQALLDKDPTGEDLFVDFFQNPAKAVLLHYLNSGLFSFQRWKEYSAAHAGRQMSDREKEDLKREIENELLTDEELKAKLKMFSERHSYSPDRLPSCGTCGVRQWERTEKEETRYQRILLSDEKVAETFRYSDEEEQDIAAFKRGNGRSLCVPVNSAGDLVDVEVWRAMSVYQARDGRHWHIHPELVDKDNLTGAESTLVCPDCCERFKAGRRPELSVSSGLDFGYYRRLGLQLPNLQEQLMLARTRLFFAAVKFTSNRKGQSNYNFSNQFKCHAILFPSREAEAVPSMINSDVFGENGLLDPSYAKALFSIFCVDDEMKADKLMQVVNKSNEIMGRSWVLAQWILVLQRLNCHYADIDVGDTVQFIKDVQTQVSEINNTIASAVTVVGDSTTVAHERILASDVAQNQTRETEGDDEEIPGPCEGSQSIRYSYVTCTEQGQLLENRKDARLAAIKRFTELHEREEDEAVDVVQNMSYVLRNETLTRGFSEAGTIAEGDGTSNTEGPSIGSSYKRMWKESNGQNTGHSVSTSSETGDIRRSKSILPDAISMFSESAEDDRTKSGSQAEDQSSLASEDNFRYDYVVEEDQDWNAVPSWETLADWEDAPRVVAQSDRDGLPVSGFGDGEDHEKNMSTCFPHIFLLGRTFKKHPGRLSHKMRIHLLHQFTLAAARDRRLLAYLFDMKQRIGVMDGVKAHVNGSRKSLETIEALLADPKKRAELQEACDDPDREGNWDLIKAYLPHLRFASSNVPYGAAEGNKYQWQAIEMNKRYWTPSNFLTISPTNLDNARAIRMAYRAIGNGSFPAVFEDGCPHGADPEDFIARLRDRSALVSEGVMKVPEHYITKSKRADLAMENPVAYVQENKSLLKDILNVLLGFDIEDQAFYSKTEGGSNRKTRFYKCRKGVFGHPLYAIGVTEDHSRGTLHWHISLLAGIPPNVLQRFYNLQGVCDAMSKVLDEMYVSDIPEDCHIGRLVQESLRANRKEWGVSHKVLNSISANEILLFEKDEDRYLRATDDDVDRKREGGNETGRKESKEPFTRMANVFASYKQFHTHCATCHKTFRGQRGCRLDFPCGECEKTRGVLLLPRRGTKNEDLQTRRIVGRSEQEKSDRNYSVQEPEIRSTYIFPEQKILNDFGNDELVVWETKKPKICPSLLPMPGRDLPTRTELIKAFEAAVERLPNYTYPRGGDFTHWLRHAKDSHILDLWREVVTQLPTANLMVPAFNPIFSYCTGSHNHCSLLGGLEQAKSALFYLVPYQGKSKFPIKEALPILNETLKYIDRNKSTHPTEAGTKQRTIKHLLTRTLNRMYLRMEISDYEIAAALLDLPSVISSDRFVVGNPAALSKLRRRLLLDEKDCNGDESLKNLCSRVAKEQQDRKAKGTRKLDYEEFSKEQERADLDKEKLDGEDLLNDYGFTRKVNIRAEKTAILVPDVALYLQRSPDLEELNYYEYLGCVEVRSGKPVMNHRKGFSQQKHFPMLTSFHGSNDVYHVLGKKQKTPLFVGRPPKHPGKKPSLKGGDANLRQERRDWRKRANRYAEYYLTLFRPHRLEDKGLSYTWSALQKWIKSLRKDPSVTSKFRLMILHQHARGLRSKAIVKEMARDYRARSRRIWSPRERYRNKELQRRMQGLFNKDAAVETDKYDAEGSESLGDIQNANMYHQLVHEKKQVAQMDRIFGNSSAEVEGGSNGLFVCRERLKELDAKIDKLRRYTGNESTKPSSEAWWKNAKNRKTAREKISELRSELCQLSPSGLELNTQQLELYDLYSRHFLRSKGAKKPPQILLCHGGPGVGKSVIRKYIDDAASACGRFCLKTSFNAINAIEMNGATTSSLLSLSAKQHSNYVGDFRYGKRNIEKVKELRKAGMDKNSLIIVEEVSNQAPWHLARLSKLCQEVLDCDSEPFGGALVILIGDLTQLGPVKAVHLSAAVMDTTLDKNLRGRLGKEKEAALGKVHLVGSDRPEIEKYRADHPHTIGSQLFTKAKWFELTQQQRSEDDSHTEFVTGNYRGRRITIEELQRREYKILSKADAFDPEWIRAPILVSTNRERQTLTHTRSIQFAKSTGNVVIRWRTKYSKWKQKPLLEEQQRKALEDPCFYEYFVPGADAFLTENIQKNFGLTNATAVVYHSLRLDQETEDDLNLQLASSRPGKVITLLSEPLAVNVEVQLSNDLCNVKTRKFLRRQGTGTVRHTTRKKDHSTYVLPIWKYNCKADSSETTVRHGRGFLPSKVTLTKHFPIEPAFAVTVHKSEGRTMKRVIIGLSSSNARGCDLSYAQVHVAFSRVRRGEHIRLLLTGSNETQQWESLLYLGNLMPMPSIRYFFGGYRAITDYANPNLDWLTNEWSREKANQKEMQRLSAR